MNILLYINMNMNMKYKIIIAVLIVIILVLLILFLTEIINTEIFIGLTCAIIIIPPALYMSYNKYTKYNKYKKDILQTYAESEETYITPDKIFTDRFTNYLKKPSEGRKKSQEFNDYKLTTPYESYDPNKHDKSNMNTAMGFINHNDNESVLKGFT